MKTILVIILASVVGLVIIGGGLGTFFSNVGEGTEKIKQNEQVQDITNEISSKLNQEKITESESSIIKNQISEDSEPLNLPYSWEVKDFKITLLGLYKVDMNKYSYHGIKMDAYKQY